MSLIDDALKQADEVDVRLDSITRILALARPDLAEPLDADAMLAGADAILEDAKQFLSTAIAHLNKARENEK